MVGSERLRVVLMRKGQTCAWRKLSKVHTAQKPWRPLPPTSTSSPQRCVYAFDACFHEPHVWLCPHVWLWVARLQGRC